MSIATHRRGNVLFELAREAGGTLDEATFVDRVSRDLAAGRFLLLIAGDGITEGTRRIGEYLQNQPGLSFDFALVEFAEYRTGSTEGEGQVILQPRILAKTVTIERHVIRSEVPGVTLAAAEAPAAATQGGLSTSSTAQAWRDFVERFAAEARFDDPGQPAPRSGGNGWIRLPLPGGLYVNCYRSSSSGTIGASVRFAGEGSSAAWANCVGDRTAIDAELAAAGLEPAEWLEDEAPSITVRHPSPAPWNDQEQERQLRWLVLAGNQFVNSLRSRLQAVYG